MVFFANIAWQSTWPMKASDRSNSTKMFLKSKPSGKELETFLNNIYVRDLGVRFTIVQDERLIEKSYKGSYAYDAGTKLINAAIGV